MSISLSLDPESCEDVLGIPATGTGYTIVQGEIGTLFKDEFECHLKCCDQ